MILNVISKSERVERDLIAKSVIINVWLGYDGADWRRSERFRQKHKLLMYDLCNAVITF
jgi:hypothetical protein